MPEITVKTLILDVDRSGAFPVVHCHGRLVAGVGDYFYQEVKALVPGNTRIVLDLTDLARVDSMGLGTLVRLYVHARAAGCQIELINIGKQVRQLLGMTHLLDAFAVIGEHGIKMG